MVFGLSKELANKKIASVAVSPGWTRTERMTGVPPKVLKKEAQSPEYIGRAVAFLALDPKVMSKSGRILEVGELAREYGFRDVDGRFWDYHAVVAKRPPPVPD